MADDEWKVVKSRLKKASRSTSHHSKSSAGRQGVHHTTIVEDICVYKDSQNECTDNNKVARRCKLLAEVLLSSTFHAELSLKMYQNLPQISDIIALGLGSPSTSRVSFLQAALLLCFKTKRQHCNNDTFEATDSSRSTKDSPPYALDAESESGPVSVTVFEPMFSAADKIMCQMLDIDISDKNLMGKYSSHRFRVSRDGSSLPSNAGKTETDGTTLFYMPHCPYRLYVNVLWANWDNLDSIAILGNSFSSYSLRRSLGNQVSLSDVEERSDCIRLLGASGLVTEVCIWEEYRKLCREKNIDESLVNDELGLLENAFCDMR
jgi:SRR1